MQAIKALNTTWRSTRPEPNDPEVQARAKFDAVAADAKRLADQHWAVKLDAAVTKAVADTEARMRAADDAAQ